MSQSRVSLAVVIPLLLLMLGGLTVANYRYALTAPGGNDFLARWVGAHAWLVEGINPYDPQVSLAAQEMIYGRPADRSRGEDVAHFVYPLPAMIFFAPFGLLPYSVARALWMTLLETALPLLGLLGIRLARWRAPTGIVMTVMLFSVLWYHGVRAVVVGQFAVIEALLLVGALLAVQRRLDVLAGILMGLAIAKPQMAFLLIPYVLLWAASARRWWIILSTLVTVGALVGVSLRLVPDWPVLWLRQVVEYMGYTELGSPVSIVTGTVPRATSWIANVASALLVVYTLIEWALSLGGDDRKFRWAAQLTIVVTNLVAFRTATTNYVILLPALCLVFGVWATRWGRRGEAFVLGSLLVLWVGLWVLFLATVEGNVESAWMYIPAPFLFLLGLWWVRWWARREPRLPLEGVIRGTG